MTTLRPPYAEIDDVEFGSSDYVVYYTGSVFKARNVHTLGKEFAGPNLHTVFNSAAQALTNADPSLSGGHIHIASPPKGSAPLVLKDAMVGITGLTVTSDNQGSTIKADPTFPTQKPMLDLRNCDRVHVESLDLDCNSAAQIGIWQRRNTSVQSTVGGPSSANRIIFNRIRNYTGTTAGFGAGVVVGLDSTETATANLMLMGNNLNLAKATTVTLTGGLGTTMSNTTGTTVTLTGGSGASLPSTDTNANGPWASHFLIKIGSEFMLCQTRSTDTLTVNRGAVGSTAATHTAGADVTGYFGSHGIRAFLGDMQMQYNNLNNPSGKYGVGIYTDSHVVVYNTHVAADALTSWACVYLTGGSNTSIKNSYLDTIQAGHGIMVSPAAGNVVSNPMFQGNYFNMQNTQATGAYGVVLDATLGNIGDVLLTGSMAKGPTSGTRPAAFLHSVNPSGQGWWVADNIARGCVAFYDGAAPDFLKPNMLDDNTTKSIVGS